MAEHNASTVSRPLVLKIGDITPNGYKHLQMFQSLLEEGIKVAYNQ
jgi:hypothetical protein